MPEALNENGSCPSPVLNGNSEGKKYGKFVIESNDLLSETVPSESCVALSRGKRSCTKVNESKVIPLDMTPGSKGENEDASPEQLTAAGNLVDDSDQESSNSAPLFRIMKSKTDDCPEAIDSTSPSDIHMKLTAPSISVEDAQRLRNFQHVSQNIFLCER